jgi:hypothetical protein
MRVTRLFSTQTVRMVPFGFGTNSKHQDRRQHGYERPLERDTCYRKLIGNSPHPNLESEVRVAAERELQQAALQDGIVKTAQQKWIFDRFIASVLRRRIAVAHQTARGGGHKGLGGFGPAERATPRSRRSKTTANRNLWEPPSSFGSGGETVWNMCNN